MDLPVLLLSEFRKLEKPTDIAVLMVNEGFDAETMRVLSAWQHTEQRWKRPKKPCPDEGRATGASWKWLRDGWSMDVAAIAIGADVSQLTATAKLELLAGSKLIYPDGTVSAAATQALLGHVSEKLRAARGKGKDKDKGKKRDEEPDQKAIEARLAKLEAIANGKVN